MKIDRRNIFRAIGATGVSLALGEQISAAKKNEESTDTYAILYDSTKCVGCQSCEYACAEANNLPEPSEGIEAGLLRLTNETRRTVVNAFSTSEGEITIKNQCMHCLELACFENCLAEAILHGKSSELLKEARKRILESPELYNDYIYDEKEAVGTGFLYLASVPYEVMGFRTSIQKLFVQ